MKGYQRKAATKRAKAHQREMRREQATQAKVYAQPTLETCFDEDEEVLCSVCTQPLDDGIFGYSDELEREELRCALCIEATEEDSDEEAAINNEGVVARYDRGEKKDARYETAQEAVRRDAGEETEAKGVMKEIQQCDEATEKARSAATEDDMARYETARGAVRRDAGDARKGRGSMTKERQQCDEATERARSAEDKMNHYEATQVARRGQSTLFCEMDNQGPKGDTKIRYEAAEKARREEQDRLEVSKRRLEDLARRAAEEKMRYEATMKELRQEEAEMIAALARCKALQPREEESKEKCYEATEELARRKVLVQCGIKPADAMPCHEATDATAPLNCRDTNKGRTIKITVKPTSTEKTLSAQEELRLQRSEAGKARRERKARAGIVSA